MLTCAFDLSTWDSRVGSREEAEDEDCAAESGEVWEKGRVLGSPGSGLAQPETPQDTGWGQVGVGHS